MDKSDYAIAGDPKTAPDVLAQLAVRYASDVLILRRIAVHRNTPPEVLRQLAAEHSSNAFLVVELCKNQSAPPALLAEIAAENMGSITLLFQIARNPNASPELLAQLAQVSNVEVLRQLAHNPHTPSNVLARLAQEWSQDIHWLGAIARNPNTPPDVLVQFAAQYPSDMRILIELAGNPSTPPEVLEPMAERSAEMKLLYQIAENPSTPEHLLAFLWEHPRVVFVRKEYEISPNTRDFAGYDASDEDDLLAMEAAIAGHPNVPHDLLVQLAQHTRFSTVVSCNPSATPQILDAIVQSQNYHFPTLRYIGRHLNTSSSTLNIVVCRLGADELDAVRAHPNLSALAREVIAYRQGESNVSQGALELMITYGYSNIHEQIASDPSTPTELLMSLRDSPHANVRDAVERNPNAPRQGDGGS